MTLLSILAISFAPAHAEDSTFAGAEKPPEAAPEKPEAHVSAELGGTYATGNAVFYAVNGLAAGSYKWDKNKLSALAGINLGSAKPDADGSGSLDDVEREAEFQQNAKRYYAEGRYDRFLSDKDSLYVLAGAFIDPFAGYDLRSHEQFGYSRLIVKTDATEFKGELGFDWAQENYVDGVDPNYQDIFAARLLLALTHAFNDNVGFSDTVEIYENVVDLNDVRVLNTAALTSNLNSKLSLKVSHSLIFDNVPVEGFQPLDQTTMVTFVATLL